MFFVITNFPDDPISHTDSFKDYDRALEYAKREESRGNETILYRGSYLGTFIKRSKPIDQLQN